jgi:hypothetical protein
MKAALAVLSFIAGIAAASAQADTLEQYDVAGWYAGAYSYDGSKQFSHCAMNAKYKSGISLVFSVDHTFNWILGFANDAWQLRIGDKYPIEMFIDGRGPIYATAEALETNMVSVPVQDDGTLFQKFRKGYRLRVIAAGQLFEFNLDGTSRGLASLVDCVSRHVAFGGTSTKSNPFVATAATPNAPSADFRAEATTVLANLLSTAGATGYHIMENEETPTDFANNHVVWTGSDYLGTFNVAPEAWDGGPEALLTAFLSRDAQSCAGDYASKRGNNPTNSAFKDAVAVSTCRIAADTFIGFYSVYPRAKGGYYIATLITAAVGEKQRHVESEAAELRDAAYTFLGN